MICWKCREAVGGPVCVSCGALQPPKPSPDLFAILGLKRRYTLERSELDAAWRALSRKVHPDRFVGRPAVERRMSLMWTASLNEARRVLRDPVSRAWYLATGAPRPSERGGPSLSPEFLEEMFELRMELEMGDRSVLEQAQARRDTIQSSLEQAFSRWEAGEGDLGAIPELLTRIKYIDNLLQHPGAPSL